MKRFVHLGINPIGAVAGVASYTAGWPTDFTKVLEDYLTSVAGPNGDWFRYAAQNYVLFTDLGLTELAQSIAALPNFQIVYVFVTEFTPAQCSGWMPKPFWDWIQKPR